MLYLSLCVCSEGPATVLFGVRDFEIRIFPGISGFPQSIFGFLGISRFLGFLLVFLDFSMVILGFLYDYSKISVCVVINLLPSVPVFSYWH